jgi:DMSO reductase family type II enzyme heme b subunit
MRAKRVEASTESLLDPQGTLWREAEEEVVELLPTPVPLQTSEYIQAVWTERQHGQIPEVRVRSLHNGEALLFRLEWDVPNPVTEISDIDVFADAAGILFHVGQEPSITEMGLPDMPVNPWFWRADLGDKPYSVTATGRGTTKRYVDNPLMSRSSWDAGTWRVVIGRPFEVLDPHPRTVELKPGLSTTIGFAVLEGANNERAGLKSYSPVWHELIIEE